MHNAAYSKTLGDSAQSVWLASFYAFPANAIEALKSAVWHSFFTYGCTYNDVLWTMKKELYGSIFLFAFLGVLGHRRSRFIAYPVIIVLNFELDLYWLNAFVAGIVLCDLYVNRNMFFRNRRVQHSPIIHALPSSRSTKFAFVTLAVSTNHECLQSLAPA